MVLEPDESYSHEGGVIWQEIGLQKSRTDAEAAEGREGSVHIWSRLLPSDATSVLPVDQTLFQAKGPK